MQALTHCPKKAWELPDACSSSDGWCVENSASAPWPYKRTRTSRAAAGAKGSSNGRMHFHSTKARLKRYRRDPAQQTQPPCGLQPFGSANPKAVERTGAET